MEPNNLLVQKKWSMVAHARTLLIMVCVCVADMLMGWWKITDMEELQALMKTLHSRGIRERALHKQVQKSMELIAQTCNKNKEGESLKYTLQQK